LNPFELYISTSTNAHENLALEEHLLLNTQKDILLFYRNKDAVVIGKHQNPWKEVDLSSNRKYQVVRRLSGGGTVYHDLGNINFSYLSNKKTDFVNFKEHIIPISNVLTELHIENTISQRNDIFTGSHKISGNAEHVNSSINRVLHHGTLLYDSNLINLNGSIRPKVALNIKTHAVDSKRSPVINIREIYDHGDTIHFLNLLIKKIKHYIPIQCIQNISPSTLKQVHKLVQDKYQNQEWNYGHTPQFLFTDPYNNQYKIRKGKIVEATNQELIGVDFEKILNHD